MIRVFGRPESSSVARVMWTIGELGLDYERIDWGGEFGGNDDPDYRLMNPTGKIPAISLGGGEILWESNAIIRYLCSAYGAGAYLPIDLYQRAHTEVWMDWSVDFADAVSRIRKVCKNKGASQSDVDAAIKVSREALAVLDKRLTGRNYVMGDNITAADFSLGVWAHRLWRCPREAQPAGLDAFWTWLRRLQMRPAYQEHVMDKVSADTENQAGG